MQISCCKANPWTTIWVFWSMVLERSRIVNAQAHCKGRKNCFARSSDGPNFFGYLGASRQQTFGPLSRFSWISLVSTSSPSHLYYYYSQQFFVFDAEAISFATGTHVIIVIVIEVEHEKLEVVHVDNQFWSCRVVELGPIHPFEHLVACFSRTSHLVRTQKSWN